MAIQEAQLKAKSKGAQLALIPGEDLTPYRDASDELLLALKRGAAHLAAGYGGVPAAPVERGGLDEFVVDLTDLSTAELASLRSASRESSLDGWAPGVRVHRAADGTQSAEAAAGRSVCYRPQDLRAAGPTGPRSSISSCSSGGPNGPSGPNGLNGTVPEVDGLLAAGTRVAQRLKKFALEATGLTASVSIFQRLGRLVPPPPLANQFRSASLRIACSLS